jgi:hypothetical protein
LKNSYKIFTGKLACNYMHKGVVTVIPRIGQW